jgi:hypothetical protein
MKTIAKLKTLPLAAVAALSLSGVAPAAPAMAGDLEDIVKSAVIGGAGGALVGAVVPGISTGKGAIIGGAGGAVYGALKKKNNRYYRSDRYGNRYYIGRDGRRYYQ